MRKIALFFVAVSLSLQSMAFPGRKDSKYEVIADKSNCSWTAYKVTGQHSGNVKVLEGSFTWNGEIITGGSIVMDMASITCSDLKDSVYNKKMVGHLKSEDFFNSEKFATSTFKLKSCEALPEDGRYTLTGTVNIKGKTESVSFPVSIRQLGKRLIIVGTMELDRTKFDIKYRSATFFSDIGDKAIKDVFDLKFQVIGNLKAE